MYQRNHIYNLKGEINMSKIKKIVSLALILSLFCIPIWRITSYAASNDNIAKLILYSTNDNTHSWIVVENLSADDITVGRYPLSANASVTVGTFGNKSPHDGVWYNIEGYAQASNHVSIAMDLSKAELETVSTTINNNNSWTLLSNCSTFASTVWNSVSSTKVSAGFPNTPSGLADSIKSKFKDTYTKDRAIPTKTAASIAYQTSTGIIYYNPFGGGGGSSSSGSRNQDNLNPSGFTDEERALLDQYTNHKFETEQELY